MSAAIFNTILTIFIVAIVGCGGGSGSESQPQVAAGDFKTLRATIVMKGMPERLVTGDVSGTDKVSIQIFFDVNNDSEFSEGDLLLSINDYLDRTTNEKYMSKYLLKLSFGSFPSYLILADIDYVISGNDITLIVDKSQAAELNLISTQTQVYVKVVFQNYTDKTTSYDYIPSTDSYTQVQNVSLIKDDLLDYDGNDSIIDIVEFRLVLE